MSRRTALGITIADALVACGLALLGGYLLAAGGGKAPGAWVEVRGAGGDVKVDLGSDRLLEIDGLRGKTVIAIRGGSVEFVSSPCPNKVCIRRGPISLRGEWIACVPNGVVATVQGERPYDGITP